MPPRPSPFRVRRRNPFVVREREANGQFAPMIDRHGDPAPEGAMEFYGRRMRSPRGRSSRRISRRAVTNYRRSRRGRTYGPHRPRFMRQSPFRGPRGEVIDRGRTETVLSPFRRANGTYVPVTRERHVGGPGSTQAVRHIIFPIFISETARYAKRKIEKAIKYNAPPHVIRMLRGADQSFRDAMNGWTHAMWMYPSLQRQ